MKKSNKILIGLILPALLGGSLFGLTSCGNKKNDFAYKVDFTADIAGQKINFWSPFGGENDKAVKSVLKEFTRLTGVQVDYLSKSSYNDLFKATSLAATHVEYPHLIVGYPDHFANYVKQDIIVRLDYYLENDIPQPFEGNQKFATSDFYSDYMRENLQVEYNKETGEPYTLGIPFNKSTEVMIYNKTFFDFFDEENPIGSKMLADNEVGPIFVPATYDQLETVGLNILSIFDKLGLYGKILLKDGKITTIKENPDVGDQVINLTGITKYGTNNDTTSSFKPFSYDSQANLFITTVRQFGGTYTERKPNESRGYLAFDSAETRQGLTRLKELYDENVFGYPNDWGEAKYSSNPFKGNKLVMTIGSSAGVKNSAAQGAKFEIGAAPVPYHFADKKFVISQGANLALLDVGSKEERLAAWTLLKFLTKYANGTLCSKMGYFPSSPYSEEGGMWEGLQADVEEPFQSYPEWKEGAEGPLASDAERIKASTADVNTKEYIVDSKGWDKFVDIPFAGSAAVREAVASITGWVFLEEKTIDQAIKAIYSDPTMAAYVRKSK